MSFWMPGTRSGWISTPRSPRATIRPSAAAMIASRTSSASGFSILAMIGTTRPQAQHLARGRRRRRRRADEGERDVVDAVGEAERHVVPVLLAHRLGAELHAREVDPLGLAERSPPSITSVRTRTPSLSITRSSSSPSSIRIRSPGPHVLGEVRVGRGDEAGVADHLLLDRDGQLRAGTSLTPFAAGLELAGPDLGPLQVLEQRDGAPLVARRRADPRDHLGVVGVAAMGEVEPRDVHPTRRAASRGSRCPGRRGRWLRRSWRGARSPAPSGLRCRARERVSGPRSSEFAVGRPMAAAERLLDLAPGDRRSTRWPWLIQPTVVRQSSGRGDLAR